MEGQSAASVQVISEWELLPFMAEGRAFKAVRLPDAAVPVAHSSRKEEASEADISIIATALVRASASPQAWRLGAPWVTTVTTTTTRTTATITGTTPTATVTSHTSPSAMNLRAIAPAIARSGSSPMTRHPGLTSDMMVGGILALERNLSLKRKKERLAWAAFFLRNSRLI